MEEKAKILEYKCPNCDAPMVFGSETQKMTCEYCGSSFDVADVQAYNESILEGRGLPQTMVTITENGVEVLVGSTEISDKERAQIEDIVKREANVKISDVVISLMNPVNTEVVEEK